MLKVALPLLFCLSAAAQTSPNRYTIPLTDPSRPANIHVEIVNGGVVVQPHGGKDVILEVSSNRAAASEKSANTKGPHRLDVASLGLEADEKDNRVHIETTDGAPVELRLLVPAGSSVKIEAVQGGDVVVEGISGNIEIESVSGKIVLTNVSGPVVAEAVNGSISASFAQIPAGKPMSLSTVNGAIDVTVPADAKAQLKIKTQNGQVLSDFDLGAEPGQINTTSEGRSKDGKFHLRLDRSVYGNLNGGGTEIRLETVNGSIHLRKK